MRYHHVSIFLIDLHDPELHGFINKDIVIPYGADVDLRTGEECLNAKDIDNHTAFRPTLDIALYHLLLLVSQGDAIPSFQDTRLFMRQQQLPMPILLAIHVYLHLIAHSQIRIVPELAHRDYTLRLIPHVHHHIALRYRYHLARHDLIVDHFRHRFIVALLHRLALLGIVVRIGRQIVPIHIRIPALDHRAARTLLVLHLHCFTSPYYLLLVRHYVN